MSRIRWFAPITKVNEETWEVEGVIALEKKDKQGEIMDYDSSKKYFEEWSNGIEKASGGKSFGNVREMHKPIAAGKVTRLLFDDDKKEIRAITKVVEDSTKTKIQEGVLNGFSIGGEYVERKRDKAAKAIRYTIRPDEVSYVDNPCMYGADFEVVRANGEVEIRKFSGNTDVAQYWHCKKDCDVLHSTKEEAKHCEGKVEKFVYANDADSEEETELQRAEKSLYDVSRLADNISSATWINVGEQQKKKFNKALEGLFSVLKGMVNDEKESFLKSIEKLPDVANTVKTVGIELFNEEEENEMKVVKKAAGKKQEEETEDQEIVDFDELTEAVTERVAKTVGTQIGKSLKTIVRDAVKESVSELNEEIDELVNVVEKIASSPRPTRAVTKAADSRVTKVKKSRKSDDDDEDEEEAPKVIKKTSDRYDPTVVKAMKAAMARPVLVKDEDTDEDEDETEEEE